MAQLQYNNVFGSPIGLRPQIIYTTGLSGYSPGPIGFWREGTGSTAISLTSRLSRQMDGQSVLPHLSR